MTKAGIVYSDPAMKQSLSPPPATVIPFRFSSSMPVFLLPGFTFCDIL